MISKPTATQQNLLERLAGAIVSLHPGRIVRVAIDGVDGAGKTVFADKLAPVAQSLGRPAIRASVDGFHNPRSVRYRQGRHSPQVFFADSYNYGGLAEHLLAPLSLGGSRLYVPAIFDHVSDTPRNPTPRLAPPDAVLIFDGLFLHRPELLNYWDLSIFLDVPFDVSIPRVAARDGSPSPDPNAGSNRRYVEGQKLYFRQCEPQSRASVLIDNADFLHPFLIRGSLK